MGLTSYASPTTGVLNPTTAVVSTGVVTNSNPVYTITAAVAAATTDILFTTSVNHNFKIGQTVAIYGALTGTGLPASKYTVKSVPAANQFQCYATTTASITYASPSYAVVNLSCPNPDTLDQNGMVKYLGGYWFIGDGYGQLHYSTDGVNWNITTPTRGYTQASNRNYSAVITDIAYDGTTWVVGDSLGNISSTTTLNGISTSWTARVTGQGTGNFRISRILWCGGTINLFIAIGGSSSTQYLATSPAGAGTWTNRTSGATSASGMITDIAFDGGSNVVITMTGYSGGWIAGANGWSYSTNGTAWTYVNTAGQGEGYNHAFYNSGNSSFYLGTANQRFPSELRTVATLGTGTRLNNVVYSQHIYPSWSAGWTTSSTSNGGQVIPIATGQPLINSRDNKIYSWGYSGNNLLIHQYSNSSPVSLTAYDGGTAATTAVALVTEGKYAYPIFKTTTPKPYVANNANQFLVVDYSQSNGSVPFETMLITQT